jgi:hypothetical protein
LQTNVVTDGPTSEAVNEPPLTETAVCAVRLTPVPDDVRYGVHEAGAVPPEMLIGTDCVVALLLMATMTVLPDPVNAERRTPAGGLPETFTRT